MKGSKWTWLAAKCKELGYKEAEELAQKMENALIEVYGESGTEEWEEAEEFYIDDMFKDDPYEVFGNREFCRGCIETEFEGCACCKFGEIAGHCDDCSSWFTQFCTLFDEGR